MASNNNRLQRTQRAFINDDTVRPNQYRNNNLLNTPQKVVDTLLQGLNIFGYNFINPNSIDGFVKIYDGMPTVGVDTPLSTIQVPANGSVVLKGADVLYGTTNDCWIAAVTGSADSNNTAPALGLIVEIVYAKLNVI